MKPKSTAAHTGPMQPIGAKVELVRPNLYIGYKGTVEAIGGKLHIVRVVTPNGGKFLAAVPFEELKVDTTESAIPLLPSQPSSKE